MRGCHLAREGLLALGLAVALVANGCGNKNAGQRGGAVLDGGLPDGAGGPGDGGGGADLGGGPAELPPRRDAGAAAPWVWGPVRQDACAGEGKRQLSAQLENIPSGTDPQAACQAAPRNLMGIDFARPDRCVAQAGSVRGQWEVPDTSCLAAPPPAPIRGGEGTLTSSAPLEGYADLHLHQMAHLGFGGTVLWGAAFGAPEQVLLPIPAAMKLGHDRSEALFDGDTLGGIIGTTSHGEDGYPQFGSWPDRTIATHQQAHEDWLHRAYLGGLRLMVMLAVNSEDMFGRGENDIALIGNVAIQTVIAPGRSTNDMETLEWQVREAYRMQAEVDARAGGPGLGWYRIARDPDEAGAAIAGGRLAVVLGTELQHLFNCDADRPACSGATLDEGLSRLAGMGVNYIFPIHHKLNQFGGPAQFNPLTNGPTYDCKQTSEACSSIGLTDLGRTFVGLLMAHGMLIDTEHMSWRALGDTLDIAEAYEYPVMASHIHAFDLATGPDTEYARTTEQWRRIFGVGGMVGIILGAGGGEFAPGAGAPVRVPISCGGADRWANNYLYAQSLAGSRGLRDTGGRIALGSDWNGFSGWPPPRYGSNPCAPRTAAGGQPIAKAAPVAYPVALPATLVPAAEGATASLPRFEWAHPWDYNERGLAQVALVPELVEDLRLAGLTVADLEALFRSARGFVEVWRTARDRQGPGDLHRVRWVPRSPFDVLSFEYWDASRNLEAAAGFPICRRRSGHALGFERAGGCQVVDAGSAPPATGARTLPPVAVTAYHAGRCLDVQGALVSDGAAVRQLTCNGGSNQQWQARTSDGNLWELASAGGSMCLDISGAAAATVGATAVQNACNGAASQRWTLARTGNTFALRSGGGLCLEVSGQSRADRAAVALATCSGAANQQWDIPSLRADDYELLYQADKNRVAWLTGADGTHPVPVTADGSRSICRSGDREHWLGAVAGGQCAGKRYDGTAATTASYETLFQGR